MSDRDIAIILLNIQLDMDYVDTKPCGKNEIDILEEEIAMLKENDSSLFYVLENIAMQNYDVALLVSGDEEE